MDAPILPSLLGRVLFLYAPLLLSLWTSWCQGLDISYCSPFNNAGNYPASYSQFQSNGLCHDQCLGSYAFAVIQGHNCWCSNYVPTPQQSTYDCNQVCPGEGNEWCGSTDAGLYAYFLLSQGVPLGTSGTGASTASSTSSPSYTPTSSSSVSTDTSTPASMSRLATGPTTSSRSLVSWTVYPSSLVVTPGSSQSSAGASVVTSSSETSTSFTISPTSTPPPSTSASSPSPTPTPTPTEVYTSVTTVTGEVRTVIVTPTPATSSDATLGQSSTGGGVSTGKVVGIVLGVALAIGILIGIGVYIWFRRRHQRLQEESGPETAFVPRTGDTSPSNTAPSRHHSQMSSAGLLANKVSRVNTSTGGLRNDPRPTDLANSSASDRRSVVTDQRLNPYALYMSEQGRVSNVSLQDNHDYSRTLRVANPDD